MEARVLEDPQARSVAEELIIRAIWLEFVGGSSHENRSITRREDITRTNDQDPSQQLKQAKLAIAELYQENMELSRQLATKTTKDPTMQGHEGNVAWLKRQLREAQNVIVQLREVQRSTEERRIEHPREGKVVEKEACTDLANAQEKQVQQVFVSTSEKHKKNLGNFEGHVSPKHYTFFRTTMTIKQPLFVHTPPTNEHIMEIRAIIAENKLLTDTCSLEHLIKGIQ